LRSRCAACSIFIMKHRTEAKETYYRGKRDLL
jgi:ribosomal protein L32